MQDNKPLPNNKLFDWFCILEKSSSAKDASFLIEFPTISDKQRENLSCNQVQHFCFPGWPETVTNNNEEDNSTAFTFALQAVDGTRRYGFCRKQRQDAQTEVCYCILSQYPWFSLFTTILLATKARRTLVGDKNVINFLEAVLKHPFPFPGERFTIRCPTNTQMLDATHYLTRPDDDHLQHADAKLQPLFLNFDVAQVIGLFACALQESRFVFCGSDINSISAACHALTALLYPFSWQHIFIPVLPYKLLDYVCAPMPFIVGIHSSMLPEVKKRPTEHLVIIDLDNKTITGADNPVALPNYNKLLTSVQKLVTAAFPDLEMLNTEQVLICFLDFLVDVFGDYRMYIFEEGGKLNFDEDRFLSTKPEPMQNLIKTMRQSQLFMQWVHDRIEIIKKDKGLPPGLFESLCSKIVPQAYGILGAGKKQVYAPRPSIFQGFQKITEGLFGKKPPTATNGTQPMNKPVTPSDNKPVIKAQPAPKPLPKPTTGKPLPSSPARPGSISISISANPSRKTTQSITEMSHVVSIMQQNMIKEKKDADVQLLDLEEQPATFEMLHNAVKPPTGVIPDTVVKKASSSKEDDLLLDFQTEEPLAPATTSVATTPAVAAPQASIKKEDDLLDLFGNSEQLDMVKKFFHSLPLPNEPLPTDLFSATNASPPAATAPLQAVDTITHADTNSTPAQPTFLPTIVQQPQPPMLDFDPFAELVPASMLPKAPQPLANPYYGTVPSTANPTSHLPPPVKNNNTAPKAQQNNNNPFDMDPFDALDAKMDSKPQILDDFF